MTRTLRISYREMERIKIITRIEQDELTVVEAAEALGISERQMYRLLCQYHAQGDAGLIHGLRGQSSNKAYPLSVCKKALRLYREQYSDYGPTLFTEKLSLYHELTLSRQTVTRWLIANGLWAGSRKKRPHRKKRLARPAIGSLIQFDGSHHDWFEGRGPVCCLLVAIDDACNRCLLRFVPVEATDHVLAFWLEYIARFGIPAEIYTDKHSVYRDPQNPEHLTQFGRALKALNIRHIIANSPQAKGRVERVNRTLQDRLLRELREHGISSIDQANDFLEHTYTNTHNHRFSHPDGLPDIHRSAEGITLHNIFCLEHERCVNYDWTIMLHAHYIQLLSSATPLPPARSKVTVREWLDGSLHIFWNEQELHFKQLPRRPQHHVRVLTSPAADHPWRGRTTGGVTAVRRSDKTLARKKTKPYNGSAPKKTKHTRRKGSVRYAHSAFPSTNAPP